MKILFLGDIVGKAGRDIIFHYLPIIKDREKIDLTIANGENSAHGKGITRKIYDRLKENGVDVITLGNHAYSKKEIVEYVDECKDLVFPYNYDNDLKKEPRICVVNDLSICVCNILGSAFMAQNAFDQYRSMNEILADYKADLYFVDLHAEATAEKLLFANYYEYRLVAVCGTHTHIQTADERLIGGCAYITDVGMNGVYDSIIGRDIEEMKAMVIEKKKTRFTVATGPAIFCGVIIEIDEKTKRAVDIKRLQFRPHYE